MALNMMSLAPSTAASQAALLPPKTRQACICCWLLLFSLTRASLDSVAPCMVSLMPSTAAQSRAASPNAQASLVYVWLILEWLLDKHSLHCNQSATVISAKPLAAATWARNSLCSWQAGSGCHAKGLVGRPLCIATRACIPSATAIPDRRASSPSQLLRLCCVVCSCSYLEPASPAVLLSAC